MSEDPKYWKTIAEWEQLGFYVNSSAPSKFNDQGEEIFHQYATRSMNPYENY